MTRVECVKLTSLFKNALATEKKKNSKEVGELEGKIESQANKFCIQLEECRWTFVSTMEKRLKEERDVFELAKKMETDFNTENSMQKKTIERQNDQAI